MLSYDFPSYQRDFGNINGGDAIDPSMFYCRFQLREGLKYYYKRNLYFAGDLLYNYGAFKNGEVGYYATYPQYPDLVHNPSAVVNRTKQDYEILFKVGKTFNHSGFLN